MRTQSQANYFATCTSAKLVSTRSWRGVRKGAALMLDALPKAKTLLGDRGYDADWFRAASPDCKIAARIPSRTNL